MRERINRLAKGIVDSELPRLFLSPEKVEETLGCNTVYKRELFLSSENNLSVKGLAYSTHSRVKIRNNSFGGLRNHITYEVDTSWCETGDTIKGTINLVTNSGELEVPFLFHVEITESVRVLSTLKTLEDFVELAQKDMELALRLMEYRDFTDAPFLQDEHTRVVFEGLKGHGNRQNALEEFFLAMGKKEPIRLSLPTAKKMYENPTDILTDRITLKKNTWGYIYIEVKADGDFIELPKKMITQADFENDRCDLIYRIHPERLHRGKNLGAIRLVTAHGETRIRIEAMGDTTVDITGRENEMRKSSILRYLKIREEYERAEGKKDRILNRMQKELDAIRGANGSSLLLSLFRAEAFIEARCPEQAASCLSECRDAILSEKDRLGTLYCFYQYLLYRQNPAEDKKQAVLKLIEKKLEQKKGRFYLQLLQLKLEPERYEEPGTLFDSFRLRYKYGCCSPFLYIEACRLLEKDPALLSSMDGFEIHVLFYGADNGMVSEELAARAAALVPQAKFYNRVYFRLLVTLYEVFGTKELLEGICALLIKGNKKGEEYFPWYEKAIEQDISLTRLYEYYLYSLPESFERALPRQVLLYFSYENSHLDTRSHALLYKNVLTCLDPEDKLYKTYEREIEQFALDQLFDSRINGNLAVIYKNIIYKDFIDAQVAKVLPAVLRSNRIECADSAMRYVVVVNGLLAGEDAYPLNDGIAYVPVYFEDSILLFQDMYGNRYADASYTITPVMDEKELENRCFEVYPEHPMLRLQTCLTIMEQEKLSGEDVLLLQRTLEELPVKPLFRQKVQKRIINYYKEYLTDEEESIPDEGAAYLLRLDKKKLSRQDRVSVCETLISQNYFSEAYSMIREFGEEGIRLKRLLGLCTNMILQKLFDEDELLLHISHRIFASGNGDSVILDYLCEHFNGANDEMYRILVQAVREHVETYDMEERLLAQLLFTGSDKHLDTVFDFYASRKKTLESIVRAYFTVRSVGYFIHDLVPADKVFLYLEGAVHLGGELRKIPEIYLLALTKFYAGLPSLSEEQAALCRRIMAVLTAQGFVFSYFKKLSRYADIPADVMDKEIIEYHGAPDKHPTLMIRILPDEESFHEDELKMVYKGIYVCQKLLFQGEIMEYEIYEQDEKGKIKKAEGEISCTDPSEDNIKNRFSALNSMSFYLNMKDEGLLKESMMKYLTDSIAAEKLFPLQ